MARPTFGRQVPVGVARFRMLLGYKTRLIICCFGSPVWSLGAAYVLIVVGCKNRSCSRGRLEKMTEVNMGVRKIWSWKVVHTAEFGNSGSTPGLQRIHNVHPSEQTTTCGMCHNFLCCKVYLFVEFIPISSMHSLLLGCSASAMCQA